MVFPTDNRCHQRDHTTKSVRNLGGFSLPSNSKTIGYNQEHYKLCVRIFKTRHVYIVDFWVEFRMSYGESIVFSLNGNRPASSVISGAPTEMPVFVLSLFIFRKTCFYLFIYLLLLLFLIFVFWITIDSLTQPLKNELLCIKT